MTRKLYTIQGQTYTLEMSWYVVNKNTSAVLISTEDSSEYRKVSVNTEKKLPANQVAIKTWSENESWINEFLAQTNWKYTGETIESSFVRIPIYEIPSTPSN